MYLRDGCASDVEKSTSGCEGAAGGEAGGASRRTLCASELGDLENLLTAMPKNVKFVMLQMERETKSLLSALLQVWQGKIGKILAAINRAEESFAKSSSSDDADLHDVQRLVEELTDSQRLIRVTLARAADLPIKTVKGLVLSGILAWGEAGDGKEAENTLLLRPYVYARCWSWAQLAELLSISPDANDWEENLSVLKTIAARVQLSIEERLVFREQEAKKKKEKHHITGGALKSGSGHRERAGTRNEPAIPALVKEVLDAHPELQLRLRNFSGVAITWKLALLLHRPVVQYAQDWGLWDHPLVAPHLERDVENPEIAAALGMVGRRGRLRGSEPDKTCQKLLMEEDDSSGSSGDESADDDLVPRPGDVRFKKRHRAGYAYLRRPVSWIPTAHHPTHINRSSSHDEVVGASLDNESFANPNVHIPATSPTDSGGSGPISWVWVSSAAPAGQDSFLETDFASSEIAIDCEWWDPRPLSLVQLAVRGSAKNVVFFLLDAHELEEDGHQRAAGLPHLSPDEDVRPPPPADENRRLKRLQEKLKAVLTTLPVYAFSCDQDVRRLRLFGLLPPACPDPPTVAADRSPSQNPHHPPNWTDLQALYFPKNECPSLQNLARKFCNLELDKVVRESNWDRRPLKRRQANYAAADAAVLFLLRDELEERAVRGQSRLTQQLRNGTYANTHLLVGEVDESVSSSVGGEISSSLPSSISEDVTANRGNNFFGTYEAYLSSINQFPEGPPWRRRYGASATAGSGSEEAQLLDAPTTTDDTPTLPRSAPNGPTTSEPAFCVHENEAKLIRKFRGLGVDILPVKATTAEQLSPLPGRVLLVRSPPAPKGAAPNGGASSNRPGPRKPHPASFRPDTYTILTAPRIVDMVKEVLEFFEVEIQPSDVCGRCVHCNSCEWISATREEVRGEVFENVLVNHETFYRCGGCRKVYWEGPLFERAFEDLEKELPVLKGRGEEHVIPIRRSGGGRGGPQGGGQRG